MFYIMRLVLLTTFFCSVLAIGPLSAFTLVSGPGDGIQCPVNPCGTGWPIDIFIPDPCGPGGKTVRDPSGSPSCEPIARNAPELIRYLHYAANKIDYEMLKPNRQKVAASSILELGSATTFTLVFEPRDGIPSSQCTETSCQIPIASEDPCGEGGITVVDSSGAPSCEPIAQIGPRLINVLRNSASELEYGLRKVYVNK